MAPTCILVALVRGASATNLSTQISCANRVLSWPLHALAQGGRSVAPAEKRMQTSRPTCIPENVQSWRAIFASVAQGERLVAAPVPPSRVCLACDQRGSKKESAGSHNVFLCISPQIPPPSLRPQSTRCSNILRNGSTSHHTLAHVMHPPLTSQEGARASSSTNRVDGELAILVVCLQVSEEA